MKPRRDHPGQLALDWAGEIPLPKPQPWTAEQRRGITTTGRSLLVSAAAGSGKTAVLAERCVHLICDAAPPCDTADLLVVTFTDAAAGQMKARIHAALIARDAASPSERLTRQIALIDQAQVSTIHGFCARVLRQYFHLVDLDPGFRVLSAEEAKLLRGEVGRDLFYESYERDESGLFQQFISAYGEGRDELLIEKVIQTHEVLCSLADPAGWIDQTRLRLGESAELPLEETDLGRELNKQLSKSLRALQERCREGLEQMARLGAFPAYVQRLSDFCRQLRSWDDTFRKHGLDALNEVSRDKPSEPLPPVSNDIPNKRLAKSVVDELKKEMFEGSWRQCLNFTAAELRAGMRRILPHAQIFLGLVEQFAERYRDAKRAMRSVDFSDLERLALRVLRDPNQSGLFPSDAARAFHRRFKHVLVDEYQDVNEVQDAILTLASRDCVAGAGQVQPNLFCVGDVKQSIYRFRLAEPARFLEKQRRFSRNPETSRGEVIDLQANFRSRAPLLDAVNAVFERLMTADAADIAYDESQQLVAGLSFPRSSALTAFTGGPLELHVLPDKLQDSPDEAPPEDESGDDEDELERAEREAILVARRIRELMGLEGGPRRTVMERDADGVLQPRPLRFGDIAVLLRSMRFKAADYSRILRHAKIPVHSESGTGFFSATEILDMLSLLELIENRRQDLPLAAVLRSPLSGLPEPEDCLARIRLAYPSQHNAVPFHEAAARYAAEQDDELAARLRDFFAQLDGWRTQARRRPLAELIWAIYQQTGYLAFCGGLRDGEQRCANLLHLHERASEFGRFQQQGLSRFVQFLQDLRDDADLGQPSIDSQSDDVVRIMSIHRAKGLEFPVVILPDLGKAINLKDTQGAIVVDRQAGLGLAVIDEERMIRYPSLASILVRARVRQQAMAEELRVMYVAMTRAREHLILIGSAAVTAPEKWRSAWSSHRGPLRTDVVLGARSMLDWLGPVAAATAAEDNPPFSVTLHTPPEVAGWRTPAAERVEFTPQQSAMAALEPLSPAPPANPLAEAAIRRMEFRYPFQEFTSLAADESVTRRAKGQAPPTPASVTTPAPAPPASPLSLPRFVEHTVSATDRGTATHLCLQHLNFSETCDESSVRRQIEHMLKRRLLTAAQAEMVDVGCVVWLMETSVGHRLRDAGPHLHREIPVYLPAEPQDIETASADPLDRTMIRGRLDVLVSDPLAAAIIDYKTDNVSEAQVPLRAASYEMQMKLYRQAIEAIAGITIAKVQLVFLKPRVIYDVPFPPT